jgi:hypothetical protein
VIETPQAQAIPAERSLAFLEAQRPALARFDIPPLGGCAVQRRGGRGWSRRSRSILRHPLAVKG